MASAFCSGPRHASAVSNSGSFRQKEDWTPLAWRRPQARAGLTSSTLSGPTKWTRRRSAERLRFIRVHHVDRGARHADVLLPGGAFTEQSATYVNTEGRPQRSRPAHPPPGEARPDWKILVALAARLGVSLGYDSLEGLRGRIAAEHPHLVRVDTVPLTAPLTMLGDAAGTLDPSPFEEVVPDYYRACPISRASVTMRSCAEAATDA